MRFLVDNALSPTVADRLRTAGHDVVHVRDRGLAAAPDDAVLALAAAEGRVLLSADTDFGTLLARSGAVVPSVILFRRASGRRPELQASLMLANLPAIADALAAGSIVVIAAGTFWFIQRVFFPGGIS